MATLGGHSPFQSSGGCRTPFLHPQTGLWDSQQFDEAEKPTAGVCIGCGVHWDQFQGFDGDLHLCALDNRVTQFTGRREEKHQGSGVSRPKVCPGVIPVLPDNLSSWGSCCRGNTTASGICLWNQATVRLKFAPKSVPAQTLWSQFSWDPHVDQIWENMTFFSSSHPDTPSWSPCLPPHTFAPAMKESFLLCPFAKIAKVFLVFGKAAFFLSSLVRKCFSRRICLDGKDLLFQSKFSSTGH